MKRVGKSGILFLLYLLLSLLLGCTPYQTYEELEAEAKITGDDSKLQKRDAQVERATAYFAAKQRCLEPTAGTVWICKGGGVIGSGIRRRETRVEDIDDLLRRYRRELSANCGCGTPAQASEIFNPNRF